MSKPLNGFVLRSVLGAGGGAEKIILRTGHLLGLDQCRLTVCGIRRTGDADYDFDQRCQNLDISYREVLQASRFDKRMLPALLEMVSVEQPDFIHAHDYKAVFLARKLGRQLGLPTIATLHGWTGHSRKEKYLYYPMERKLLRSFDRVLAVSKQISDTFVKSGGDANRVHVILNGIDPAEFTRDPSARTEARQRLNIAPDDLLLIGLGRLERQKRFDILLETAERLLRDGLKFQLIIAGEGSLKGELQQQLNDLELQNCCRLIGHWSDVKSLYHAADMLVQSSDYEGTPTVVVEAMAMELPIVATDAGGTAELMDDGVHGKIVPCRNPQSLAAAIRQTAADSKTTKRQVRAARQRAENELSFANRTRQLLEHYRAIAQPGNVTQPAAGCPT